MDRDRAALSRLCPVDSRGRRRAASYAIRRHAEGGGRKDILELGDADGAAPYLQVEIYRPGTEIPPFADSRPKFLRVPRRSGRPNSGVRAGPGQQVRAADCLFLYSLERHAAPMPGLCARLRRSAPAIVRLVLPGRQRIHPAEHLRLRTRSIDAAGRRQRAESRRAVCASRTQPQLLRPARSDPGRDAEISSALEGAGKPAGAAPHRALSVKRGYGSITG